MKTLIMDKWEMEIDDTKVEKSQKEKGEKRSYFSFLKKVSVGRQAKCRYNLLIRLQNKGIENAVEFFGGVGINSTMIQKIIEPENHYIYDYDEKCVEHLNKNFENVFQADSYQVMQGIKSKNALYDFDFNSFTIKQLIENEKRVKNGIDNIFSQKPKAVIITDSAKSKIHLNYKVYERLLNAKIGDFNDYISAVDEYFQDEYNYSISHCYFHNSASYSLFQPVKSKEIKIEKINDNKGFKIIGE